MKKQTSCLAQNLITLRQKFKYSQEYVANQIGVSRQTVTKWESGETLPDIVNCDALASLYHVDLDNLIHFDQYQEKMSIPPKGKHLFGVVKVGERGQIVLPKKARDIFHIKTGDLLVVLGNETPGEAGIALLREDEILKKFNFLNTILSQKEEEIE